QRRQLIGMLPRPRLDRLHRRPVRRERAALDEHTGDRAKRLPVLIGVAHAHDSPLGQLDAPRTLDLQEERLDRVIDEDELLAHDGRLSGLDVGALPVRNHALAVDPAAHALVLELRIEVQASATGSSATPGSCANGTGRRAARAVAGVRRGAGGGSVVHAAAIAASNTRERRRGNAMVWFFIEIGVALLLAIFIVWFTM